MFNQEKYAKARTQRSVLKSLSDNSKALFVLPAVSFIDLIANGNSDADRLVTGAAIVAVLAAQAALAGYLERVECDLDVLERAKVKHEAKELVKNNQEQPP